MWYFNRICFGSERVNKRVYRKCDDSQHLTDEKLQNRDTSDVFVDINIVLARLLFNQNIWTIVK